MYTCYFDAAMCGIEQALLADECDASLIAAQTLEASLLMEHETDPEQMGLARYYTLRSLHALGAWREGYEALLRPSPKPFSLSSENATWMNLAGAEMAARLGVDEQSVCFLSEAVELRLRDRDEGAAAIICQKASGLLTPERFAVFIERLEEPPAAAPSAEAATARALLCSEIAGQAWFQERLPPAVRRRRNLAQALRAASALGDLESVDLALSLGAEPDARVATAPGLPTALLAAAFEGRVEVVARLLAAGADPEAANLNGRTPLLLAASRGHAAIVRLLVRAGVALESAAVDGQTALHAAVSESSTQGIAAMLEAGANLESRDGEGRTPLIVAAIHGETRIVCQLLCWGADIQARDDFGMSALDRARIEGHPVTAAALRI